MFAEQTKKLVNKWNKLIQKEANHEVLIEVNKDLCAVTLDIIGIGGFNCEFDSLEDNNPKSLSSTYHGLMLTFQASIFMILPGYSKIPTERTRNRKQYLQRIKQ